MEAGFRGVLCVRFSLFVTFFFLLLMVSEKQVAAVGFRVGFKTGAIQPLIQTFLKSLADSQLPMTGFIHVAPLYRLDVSRDFDDRFRLFGAAGAFERAGDAGRTHPPLDENAVAVQAAMKGTTALIAVVIDAIHPHDAPEFDYV